MDIVLLTGLRLPATVGAPVSRRLAASSTGITDGAAGGPARPSRD